MVEIVDESREDGTPSDPEDVGDVSGLHMIRSLRDFSYLPKIVNKRNTLWTVIFKFKHPDKFGDESLFYEKFLPLIKNQNSKQEFYLTDLPVLVSQAGLKAGAFITDNELEFSGVNTQEQLTQLQNFLMNKGK